jgi:hypothetical protein
MLAEVDPAELRLTRVPVPEVLLRALLDVLLLPFPLPLPLNPAPGAGATIGPDMDPLVAGVCGEGGTEVLMTFARSDSLMAVMPPGLVPEMLPEIELVLRL